MSDTRFKELFTRHSANPIIQARDLPYQANAVFNAGVTQVDGDTLLLLRVEDRRGLSHLTAARSRDGITGWRIDTQPTLAPDPVNHPEEIWGIEDPRFARLDTLDLWAVVYTAYSRGGPLVSLATTRDFKTFERKGVVMPPEDKDAALFPVQFNGRWAMIHRPVPGFAGVGAHIWISFSPDMKHWGDHQILLPARKGGWWDANKVGLSPPPLRTEKGWLILYHGVRNTASGCIYRLGLALLDLQDPTRLLARADEWVFAPEEAYEVVGDVDKVVFPCGWVAEGDDIRLYYGGADKCIALATARVSELLDWIEKHNQQDRRAWS
ncbi:MAG: glycosidase [Deltaproteobacteria bacterium]|nr:glycosidase [Deltaproteobacteria bacterium]MBW1957501.1 glycosidase [Deltaproteobacteria bacterium]MBW2013535.1 glycosidase [Deltaproteobacteria bacterium]MBW2088533.1 glycosidase [Deltaproteobacteria bacterium]